MLEGCDFDRWRPWVIVVEATRPNDPAPAFQEWEHLLLGARYMLAYADGLNRFYVAEEHNFLVERLGKPPNVFDNYVGVGEARARHGLAASSARGERTEARLAAADARVAALELRLSEVQDRLTILAAERDAAVQEMFEANRVACDYCAAAAKSD